MQESTARRSGCALASGRRLRTPRPGRTAPNTQADSGGPALRSRAAVPGSVPRPVPILVRSQRRGHSKAAGSPSEEGLPFGRAHGRGGSSGVGSFFARRRGGGRVDLGGGFGLQPVILGPLRAEPVVPRPTSAAPGFHRTTEVRRRPVSHPCGGLPGLDPDIPGRTRGPLTVGCHRTGWPSGLPFGVGSPAVPWLNVSRSG